MPDRECPSCGKDTLMNAANVSDVYPSWRKWGATALLEDSRRCCPWCKYIEMDDGSHDRLQSRDERAYELSQAGTKSKNEYRDRLGELPTTDSDESGGGAVEDTGKAW